MVSIGFRRSGVILLEKLVSLHKCILIHKCNFSFLKQHGQCIEQLYAFVSVFGFAILFVCWPAWGGTSFLCLVPEVYNSDCSRGAASRSLRGPETSSQMFTVGEVTSIQLQSFLLNQLKPVLWKNKTVEEKLRLFFTVSFISSKFGRVNSSNRIAPTWDEVICSYLTVEQKDLILVLQWLIFSIWLKFTHLKLHHVGRSIFNHEVVPDTVMTESNLQVLSSHNSHRPFQEVYGALEDWTLQYPSEVSKLHSEKLKALQSAVSLASVKRVFLNSRVTIQKWGFGFGVTLGTPGNLTAGSYLILLMDQWGLLQCELSRMWLCSLQAFLVSDVWVSVMLVHITDLRGGSESASVRGDPGQT